MSQTLYKSRRWKRKREAILRRDKYMCQESKRYGKTEPATTVHHIYPLEFYPELAFVDWNLISLSDKQHNAMHERVTHELTALGRAWQERVRDKFEAERRARSAQ
ncbi:HNH endonuclease [Brevibacillus antibioticus]|uniref:HNH endonuclease n=1 Tax=Brevibacillus antibioticus TaxID=2570228 RepID=A0A4U2Y7B5_9BACL|nr:HNH endonuclease [Brevibacillus antibioticus]TKI55111.1 HNH endonuclease [Brevibacillus antibioticus]